MCVVPSLQSVVCCTRIVWMCLLLCKEEDSSPVQFVRGGIFFRGMFIEIGKILYFCLFTSRKGVVSLIKTSCAHSVTLKRINKTHLFMHFHIVIWTRELLWKYPSCLSKLLLHELWPKQFQERFITVPKL